MKERWRRINEEGWGEGWRCNFLLQHQRGNSERVQPGMQSCNEGYRTVKEHKGVMSPNKDA